MVTSKVLTTAPRVPRTTCCAQPKFQCSSRAQHSDALRSFPKVSKTQTGYLFCRKLTYASNDKSCKKSGSLDLLAERPFLLPGGHTLDKL